MLGKKIALVTGCSSCVSREEGQECSWLQNSGCTDSRLAGEPGQQMRSAESRLQSKNYVHMNGKVSFEAYARHIQAQSMQAAFKVSQIPSRLRPE
jgi:hypothetical protein